MAVWPRAVSGLGVSVPRAQAGAAWPGRAVCRRPWTCVPPLSCHQHPATPAFQSPRRRSAICTPAHFHCSQSSTLQSQGLLANNPRCISNQPRLQRCSAQPASSCRTQAVCAVKTTSWEYNHPRTVPQFPTGSRACYHGSDTKPVSLLGIHREHADPDACFKTSLSAFPSCLL
jgi:hypothetical protein